MQNSILKRLYFSPVKSLSFSETDSLLINKNIGIKNDRIFAFTRIINESKSKEYEEDPLKRNLNFFLTLKNSPFLNKYNFELKENELTFLLGDNIIKKISLNKKENLKLITNELKKCEPGINYIPYLIKNINFPFFDTMPQNSISLINLNSIKDFENQINFKIEHERFRANIYIDKIDPWAEFSCVNKIITINNCIFKILKKIPRCSAINLRLNSDKVDINLPKKLREIYGHIDMGIYLKPLNNGIININDKVTLS